MARHREGDFPLTGAHQAVPCLACHREPVGSLPAAGAGGRFRFPDDDCRTCHGDPHRGETRRFVDAGGCVACHGVESWRAVSFDHGQTEFPLAGGHREVQCLACHRTIDLGGPEERIRFLGLPSECAACHADPHAGQFADAAGLTTCGRCHRVETWERPSFDHDRDAAFPLRGAHERVPCASCHPTELDSGGREYLRFRPLPTDCAGCHSG